jgi:hypothetical protein
MIAIDEITDPSLESAYVDWQANLHIPRILESKLSSACFEFRLYRVHNLGRRLQHTDEGSAHTRRKRIRDRGG